MKGKILFAILFMAIGFFINSVFVSNHISAVNADCQDDPCTNPPCCNGDVNGDASIDISDAVYILNYLFSGGVEPISLPPKSPGNISCSYSGEAVHLSWSNSDNYESIEIQKNGNVMVTLPGTATTYEDDQVEEGNTYSYAMIGIDGKESSPTVCAIKITDPCPDCDSCCPPAPPTITDCSYSDGTVHFVWENNDSYTSIEINGDPIAGDSTQLEDSSVTPGESYTYSIVGIRYAGTSAPVMCWINIPEDCPPCDSCCEPESEITVMLPGDIPLEMVHCPAGTFMMGRNSKEQGSYENEDPQHEVTLTKDFYLGKYEVTKSQWESVMGTKPWIGQEYVLDDPDSPAVYVSWNDAQEFITELNSLGKGTFRLPTEAECEYACRAGTTTRYYWGNDPDYTAIGDYIWFENNAENIIDEMYAHKVGQKLPNSWGLFDMSGNVWEWCQDYYGEYPSGSVIDPTGPEEGGPIIRCGGWTSSAIDCRSARRHNHSAGRRFRDVGFRLVRSTCQPCSSDCPSNQLQATGQTNCYDEAGSIIPCDSSHFPGQDAYYQFGYPPDGRFVDNDDGTIMDNCTGLVWQQAIADTDTDGSIDEADKLTWQDALQYCDSLDLGNHTDWRLPNVRELHSLVDYGRSYPAIDSVFDAECPESQYIYWSSTSYTSISDRAWTVTFGLGHIGSGRDDKILRYYVRAVRTGNSTAPEKSITVPLPEDAPLEMVYCPPGTFMMGANEDEQDSQPDEFPQHEVTLTKGFYLGRYEVTKRQWESVMDTRPWEGQPQVLDDPESPAVYVSWYDAQAFVTALNKLDQGTFYLPTEAEWEYACRAGTTTRFYWGDDPDYAETGTYAWFKGNALDIEELYAHVVGQKLPNNWGLYDMSGNVWEWCADWYGDYPSSSQADPTGPASGTDRVNRGGEWRDYGRVCRSANRGSPRPDTANDHLGFRVALIVE